MLTTWLDRLGDRNPQLFRELKGRLRSRNVLATVAGSLLVQGAIVLYFWLQLPNDFRTEELIRNPYCVSGEVWINENAHHGCLRDAASRLLIDFDRWWFDVSLTLAGAIVVALVVGGVFLLVNDLTQEQQRGTLNFLRLSPQSARTIFLGKLLGVPVLVYLGVLAAVPLQLFAALQGQYSLSEAIAFYLVLGAGCALFYSLAALVSLLSKQPSVMGIVLGGLVTYPYAVGLYGLFALRTANKFGESTAPFLDTTPIWWNLPLLWIPIYAQAFVFVSCLGATYWVWVLLERRYQQPSATPLRKGQSYALNACIQVYLVGFAASVLPNIWNGQVMFGGLDIRAAIFLDLLVVLLMTAAIAPQRQALQDWARYRHLSEASRVASTGLARRYSLTHDLLWGEKSPAVLAIAVHVAIVSLKWLVWVAPWQEGLLLRVVALLSTAAMLVGYGAIAQWLLLLKTPKRAHWAVGVVLAALVCPAIALSVVSTFSQAKALWAMFVFSSSFLSFGNAYVWMLGAIALGQCVAAIVAMSSLLNRLERMGASDTQRLLEGRDRLREA